MGARRESGPVVDACGCGVRVAVGARGRFRLIFEGWVPHDGAFVAPGPLYAPRVEMRPATGQPQLGAPGGVDRRRGLAVLATAKRQRHRGMAAVVPGRFDQQPPRVGRTSLGDRTLATLLAAGPLTGNETEEAGQQPRMRERREVADLGDQPDRGQRVDATQASQPADRRSPGPVRGLLGDQAVQAITTRQEHLVAGQILPENRLRQRVLKPDRAQPRQVPLRGPGCPGTREDQAPAQQQLPDPMPRAHQIPAQVLAGTNQVAQRLELQGRDLHRPQLPRRVQPGELQRIARVGLGVIARLARNRAGRTDHHLHPGGARRPREPEPGRAGLIDRADRAGQRLQPADRLQRRARDLRLEHLPGPQLHRGRRRPPGMHIQTGEADTFRHVDAPLPSMR